MERYFYFGEATVETTGQSALFPLSSFLGMTPAGANSTTMHFNSRNGEATDDIVTVEHTARTPKQFMTEIVKYMQKNQRTPFLIVDDGQSGLSCMQTAVSLTIGVATES